MKAAILNEVVGDLFTSDAPAIGHGVNNVGVMGAGIAAQFARRYPDMLAAYKELCEADRLYTGSVFFWHDPQSGKHILNLCTQDMPGKNALYVWVRQSLTNAIEYCVERDIWELAIPRIGCGIGGLQWDRTRVEIKRVLEETMNDEWYTEMYPDKTFTLTVYEFGQ